MSDADIMAMAGLSEAALQVAGNITASTFNYRHTKELAQWQNDMNIRNWEMQNEYNLPENQIKRFVAAGLNPNLMYGQGNPGNAGSVPSVSAPGHNEVRNPFEGVQLASMYQQVKNEALQGKQIEVNIEGQRIRNNEQEIKLNNMIRAWNAAQTFKYDHTEGPKDHVQLFAYDDQGRLYSYYSDSENDYYKFYRSSPEYKDLELKWQKGEINKNNINLLIQEYESGLRRAGSNSAFDRVFSGEGDFWDILRLIGEMLSGKLGYRN